MRSQKAQSSTVAGLETNEGTEKHETSTGTSTEELAGKETQWLRDFLRVLLASVYYDSPRLGLQLV